MTALPDDAPEGLLTIDELAVAVGMTVRNTRYYASLGLMPPPIKRGRVAYYDDVHRARLGGLTGLPHSRATGRPQRFRRRSAAGWKASRE